MMSDRSCDKGPIAEVLGRPEPLIEFWRLPTVMQAIGLSRAEIYKRIARGQFPRHRKYHDMIKSFWIASEIVDWQRAQIEGQDEFEALLS